MERMKVLAKESEIRIDNMRENFESKKNEWMIESLEARKTKLKFPYKSTKKYLEKIDWSPSPPVNRPRWLF
jgi:hypothetical protein